MITCRCSYELEIRLRLPNNSTTVAHNTELNGSYNYTNLKDLPYIVKAYAKASWMNNHHQKPAWFLVWVNNHNNHKNINSKINIYHSFTVLSTNPLFLSPHLPSPPHTHFPIHYSGYLHPSAWLTSFPGYSLITFLSSVLLNASWKPTSSHFTPAATRASTPSKKIWKHDNNSHINRQQNNQLTSVTDCRNIRKEGEC